MANINKFIRRINQETFKKIVFLFIEKIKDKSFTEEELLSILDSCIIEDQGKPNLNKRGKSGYNVFVSEQSAKFKQTDTTVPFKQQSKKIGELWKNMTNEEKEVYNIKAKNNSILVDTPLCKGIKQDGSICNKKIRKNNDTLQAKASVGEHSALYCKQHLPKEEKVRGNNMCSGITNNNTKCSRKALEGEDLCKMHLKKSSLPSQNKHKALEIVKPTPDKICIGLKADNNVCAKKASNGDYCNTHFLKYNITETLSSSYPDEIEIEEGIIGILQRTNKEIFYKDQDDICYTPNTHSKFGFFDNENNEIIYDN